MFPKTVKILIVDDMVGMRQLIKSNLSQMGYRDVTQFEDGRQAYRALVDRQKAGSPFELVLSDWNMPNMRGIDLLRMVRQTPGMEDLPFLLITAENEFHQVKEAIDLRVSEYILKPFTRATIQAKLESAWKKHCQKASGAGDSTP